MQPSPSGLWPSRSGLDHQTKACWRSPVAVVLPSSYSEMTSASVPEESDCAFTCEPAEHGKATLFMNPSIPHGRSSLLVRLQT
jgi:hypothetical protein